MLTGLQMTATSPGVRMAPGGLSANIRNRTTSLVLSRAYHSLPLPESLWAFSLLTSCLAIEFPACVRDWLSTPFKGRLCVPQMGMSVWESGQHHFRVGSDSEEGTLMRRVESTPPSNGERKPGWSLGGLDFRPESVCSSLSDRRFFICVFSVILHHNPERQVFLSLSH